MSNKGYIIVGAGVLLTAALFIGMTAGPSPSQSSAAAPEKKEMAKVVMLTTTGPLPACTSPMDLGALTAIKNDRTYYRYIAEHEGCMEIPAGRTMAAQCSSDRYSCFVQSNRGAHYMVKLIAGSYQITE